MRDCFLAKNFPARRRLNGTGSISHISMPRPRSVVSTSGQILEALELRRSRRVPVCLHKVDGWDESGRENRLEKCRFFLRFYAGYSAMGKKNATIPLEDKGDLKVISQTLLRKRGSDAFAGWEQKKLAKNVPGDKKNICSFLLASRSSASIGVGKR